MVTGLLFTTVSIVLMRSVQIFGTDAPLVDYVLGINAPGIGTVGMLINFAVTIGVSLVTTPPPADVVAMAASIRYPIGTATDADSRARPE
ncbi:MAG: hypothetical protein ACRELX_13730 [Longimicrobiales bacterium]